MTHQMRTSRLVRAESNRTSAALVLCLEATAPLRMAALSIALLLSSIAAVGSLPARSTLKSSRRPKQPAR